ncbi:MAG: hypothetical protein U9N10_06820 [Bacillota bacterium]|nr:hypothetical protein [Bacillota bacterium]
MDKKSVYGIVRILSLLLFIILSILYLLWFKILEINGFELQTTPTFLVTSSIIGVLTIAIVLTVLVRKKEKKALFFIVLNVISLILIVLFLWLLPTTGFTEHNFNRIVSELSIENASRVSAGAPANEIFPIDEDESVDIQKIVNLYDNNYTEWITGEISDGGKTIKVLVIYQQGVYYPKKSTTILELNSEYEVALSEMEQGYNRYTYPIEKILIAPNSK